ncbi:MAG: tRNA (adenosine(37)-N6)-threonylcarbamoyltransferase complex dimerization subunit type 1 TsaB [Gammaproteobacteria bacterium]|nr:tRNA (adenosine(37)-N6)-threonylcarbamoyltransferase complex dimerization subunit type 1 TsaB [Gammaproteobacteria bacterium]
MRILAIETTTDVCSIAVSTISVAMAANSEAAAANSEAAAALSNAAAEPSNATPAPAIQRSMRTQIGLVEDTRIAPRLHNRLVLGMIDALLGAMGIAPKDLDALAFSAGPGSFTGVRIGASVCQGIALAADLPVVRVPTSAVLARAHCDANRGDRSVGGVGGVGGGVWGIVTVRRSRKGYSYVAKYEQAADSINCVAFDRLSSDEEVLALELADGWMICGDCERNDAVPARPLSARLVAMLAVFDQASEASPVETYDAAAAIPYYVEGDSPWKKSL